ncbi:MAG TPA: hypothetical protein VN636_11355, partial [Acidimicrobiia bacterium]|nr:hypothetical protein [Acidimicrobiia bacterium]
MTADFAAGPFDIDWDAAVADTVFGRAGEIGLEHEEFAEVVELVRIARRPGSVDELIGDDAMIARIAAAVDEARAPIEPSPLSRVTKRHSVRFAAAIAVMAMIGGTAAAASTGSLPPHVQNSLATRLAVVGIDLPVHHPRHRAVHPAAA